MWWLGIAAVTIPLVALILSRNHWRGLLNAASGIASEYNHQYIYDDDNDNDDDKKS
jgi:hypothetical protein